MKKSLRYRVFFYLLLLFITGCAYKPLTTVIDDPEFTHASMLTISEFGDHYYRVSWYSAYNQTNQYIDDYVNKSLHRKYECKQFYKDSDYVVHDSVGFYYQGYYLCNDDLNASSDSGRSALANLNDRNVSNVSDRAVGNLGPKLSVYFDFDIDYLDKKELIKLRGFYNANLSKDNKDKMVNIFLSGYADVIGGDNLYNVRLSQKRANFVKRYFIKLGLKPENINVEFYGAHYARYTSRLMRRLDRRVDIVVSQRKDELIKKKQKK